MLNRAGSFMSEKVSPSTKSVNSRVSVALVNRPHIGRSLRQGYRISVTVATVTDNGAFRQTIRAKLVMAIIATENFRRKPAGPPAAAFSSAVQDRPSQCDFAPVDYDGSP